MTKTGTEDERVSKMFKGIDIYLYFVSHFLFTLGQKEKRYTYQFLKTVNHILLKHSCLPANEVKIIKGISYNMSKLLLVTVFTLNKTDKVPVAFV